MNHFFINTTDKNIIESAINIIIKNMQRKIKNDVECPINTMLLLCPNLILKRDVYDLKQNKAKKNFIIPVLLIIYINDNTITIKIVVNKEDLDFIKKNNIIIVNIDTCSILFDFGFTFYLESFGEKLEVDKLKKVCYLKI